MYDDIILPAACMPPKPKNPVKRTPFFFRLKEQETALYFWSPCSNSQIHMITVIGKSGYEFCTENLAARICYLLADKFYVQHREALAIYGKKAEYIGGVL